MGDVELQANAGAGVGLGRLFLKRQVRYLVALGQRVPLPPQVFWFCPGCFGHLLP